MKQNLLIILVIFIGFLSMANLGVVLIMHRNSKKHLLDLVSRKTHIRL